ncbi:SRPBCC family protein [Nocardioides sp. GY 10127]|uniref:SRPBCC family protein n=1 Tax=Nocardioides sp. GY 10127 TaxID=2569762 RepID=UPI001457E5EA|nr:SRPBCC family protein [Nocardioides sp. GY 10127]
MHEDEREDPARDLRVSRRVAAPCALVWEALADLRRMPRRSPELVAMLPLAPGPLRPGLAHLGLNRRGPVVWPTRNVLTDVVPGRRLAWRTTSSGATWAWELEEAGEATLVVHSRRVEGGLTLASRVVAPALLGGSAAHAAELEEGMRRSVEALAAEVEQGRAS